MKNLWSTVSDRSLWRPGLVPIIDGIYRIQREQKGANSALVPVANTYLLGEPEDNDVTLVDPGFLGCEADIFRAICRLEAGSACVRRVVMTHTHADHFACLPTLLRLLPRCEVWVHRHEGVPLEDGDERTVYGNPEYTRLFREKYGLRTGIFGMRVHRKLDHLDTFAAGDVTWSILHTPGHSAGGICLYRKQGEVLISGDTVFADGTVGRTDMHGASRAQLADSVAMLSKLRPKLILPGHGRPGIGPFTANWATRSAAPDTARTRKQLI